MSYDHPKSQYDNILVDHRYFTGTLTDFSGNDYNGIWAGAGKFTHKVVNETRSSVATYEQYQRIVIGADAALDGTSGTLIFYGKFPSVGSSAQRLIDKQTIGKKHLEVWMSHGSITLKSGAVSNWVLADWDQSEFIAITYDSGNNAYLYLDGAYIANFGSTVISSYNVATTIGNYFGGNIARGMFGEMLGFLWYSVPLTSDEISDVHDWTKNRRSLFRQHNNFFIPSMSSLNDGLVNNWNLSNKRDMVSSDYGPNNQEVRFESRYGQVVRKQKTDLFEFDGTSSYCTASGISNILKSGFSLSFEFIDESSGTDNVMFHPHNNNDYPDIRIDNNVLYYRTASANSISSSIKTNRLMHGVLSVYDDDPNVSCFIYIDGEQRASGTITKSSDGLSDDGGLRIGSGSLSGSTKFQGCLRNVRTYNKPQTSAEVSSDYKEYASESLWAEDFTNCIPSTANESGINIGGSSLVPASAAGTFKIISDSDFSSGKCIKCMSSGNYLYSTIFQPHAYGSFTFAFKKADISTLLCMFNAELPGGWSLSGQYGYYMGLNNTEQMYFARVNNGSATTHARTAASYFSIDTFYRVWIQRRAIDGQWTFWIKGGSFTSWAQIDMSDLGSNPITQDTVTESKYFVTYLNNGASLGDIMYFRGSLQPNVIFPD